MKKRTSHFRKGLLRPIDPDDPPTLTEGDMIEYKWPILGMIAGRVEMVADGKIVIEITNDPLKGDVTSIPMSWVTRISAEENEKNEKL